MASARFGQVVRSISTSSVSAALARAPVQVYGTEGRYAHALYSAAVKEKKVEAVEKELNSISNIIKENKKFDSFLKNPLLKKQDKKAAIEEVLKKEKCSQMTTNLFTLMAENGRLQDAAGVLKAYGKIMSAVRGEILCEVVTAKPLEAEPLKELKTVLQGFLEKGQTLQLETKVDPSIIGGMLVSIGDKYVDLSISTKIKAYTDLIKQPV